MTTQQLLFNGQKSVPLDMAALNNDDLWSSTGGSVPVSRRVSFLYGAVGLLYRCVQIRANSLTKVPWEIANAKGDTIWKKGEEPPADLQFLKPLPRLLFKTEAALCLGSQAYWHKERNRVRTTALRWLAPVATEPYWDPYKGLTHFIYHNGVSIDNLSPADVVYIWYQHPLYEDLRDVSPAEAAMTAAGVLYSVDSFTTGFFERGAVKVTLLTVQGNPPPAEKERLKAWWDRLVGGAKNAFKSAVVNADSITPVIIGEGISELSNTELTEEKRNDIAVAMGIPLSMVFSDAANYATAQQDEANFYNSTIVPDCELIAEQLDEQLFAPYGYHMVFKPEAMDIFQADEGERATTFKTYVDGGMARSLAAQVAGVKMPDGWTYEDLDVEDESKEPEDPAVVETDEDVESEESQAAEDEQEERQNEARRFRAWAGKRTNADPAKFKSDYLSEADKVAILLELKEGGAGQAFFTQRVTLPDGPLTPDVVKSMLLQLDREDDEAERNIRDSLEARSTRQLAEALAQTLAAATPGDDDDVAGMAARIEQELLSGRKVRDVLERMLIDSADLGVSVAVTQLEGIGFGFDWTLANVAARDYAQRHAGQLITQIADSTRRGVQQAVARWVENGEPLPALVKDLQPLFGKRRAKLIAATEVTTAYAEGNIAAWREAGFDGGRPTQQPPAHPGCRCWLTIRINDDGSAEYVWQTARDERRCPVCRELHDKPLGIAKGA